MGHSEYVNSEFPHAAINGPGPASERPVRFGIVGMGRVGARRAECLQKMSDTRLTSICDLDPQIADQWLGYAFSTDYRTVTRGPVDAVVVCAYNHVAAQIAIDALAHGKHVFCEKPPGRNRHEVEAMRTAANQSPGSKLKFGFNHRYHGSVHEAKRIIDSGDLGRVLWLRGAYGKSGGVHFAHEWRNQRELSGGGILLDQGIHMVDLCRYLGGDYEHIQSHVTTAFWDVDVEDNAFAILSSSAGPVAMLHSSATQWKHRFELEICLERGYLRLEGILSGSRSYGEETLTIGLREFENEAPSPGRPREQILRFTQDTSWSRELRDFVRDIRQDRAVVSGNVEDALRTMVLIDSIYSHGRLTVPHRQAA